ncbi:MAG: HAMP domain-containing histidine kinase [Deltaproteobacteria bacterium]|nr:MAG: HAMP domain-containing histidine kinase [Deltaproteobacteria bacterium]
MKQQKSVGAPVLGAPHVPPLDVLRLEQFLDLQQTLLAVAGDADALPERLVHAVAVFLGVEGTAVGIVEDGRYRLLATHGLEPAYRARFDGLAAHEEAIGAALAASRPLVLPATGDTGAGSTLLLPFGRLAPPGDPSGALAGALHVILPAAGLPALANARQARRLARIARLKGDALSTMAHDLRAPLNALIGYTSLLGEGAFGPLTEEQQDVAATLERQAIELVDLLGATLDVARLETGRLPLRIETFGLPDVLAALEAGTFARASHEGLIVWHAALDLPPLRSDRVKVKEIVQNLVDNALKHHAGRGVEVDVGLAPDAGRVRITVRDRGPGIAVEVLPRLFEPFSPGDGRSTGFGLYIVRCLVEALGGRVAARSEPGEGTAVTVELPLAAPLR